MVESNKAKMEKEFYSKVCVAISVKFVVKDAKDEANEEGNPVKMRQDQSESDKFSCSLATILARDREVAVNLKLLNNKAIVYISKNSGWSDKDHIYIGKIKELITNLSKAAPVTYEQMCKRADVIEFCYHVFEYCSVKFTSRLEKLKGDIMFNKNKQYIKSFLEFAETDNLDDIEDYDIFSICNDYCEENKNDSEIPERFLGHIKKMGSYIGSVMGIANCACKEKYKDLFGCIDLRLLDPIFADQLIFSWSYIVKKCFGNPKEFEDTKKKCIKNDEINDRLTRMYGGIRIQLDCERTNHIYLHAELNILNHILMGQDKGNDEFIAVSKKCCFLCELYIRFVRSKGYKIAISGIHKKLYHLWKLPENFENFKKEFMEQAIFNLDQIIDLGLKRYNSTIAKSDSEGDSGDARKSMLKEVKKMNS